MTSPAAQQAPNGYLQTGAPADSVDAARDDMINVFLQQTSGLKSNTGYYEATERPEAIGMAIPQEMRSLLAFVGYPRLYVDSLSDRLELEGFRLGTADKADDQLWDWWQANNLDVEAPLGHNEAFVHGRSYITIAAPDPAVDLDVDQTVPIIRVEPPTSLYAVIDPRTRQVTQAIRNILGAEGTPKAGQTVGATLYLPNQTVAWTKDNTGAWVVTQQVPHNLGIVPVVPITNRTMLSDLYGTSEITPELRSVTDAAARILMNMQGAAELMGVPQRLLFGVKPQDIGVDPETGTSKYDAYMARILAFEESEGKAFQFMAAELRNFCDALDQLDRKAAAYCGLPPQYISYSSQNPASAEAIGASESRLVKKAERKTTIFGGSWEQAMRIAVRVMGTAQLPPQYYRMESIWRDPATPTYSAKADAATKLYASGLGVIPKKRARFDMGYSVVEVEEMEKWDTEENPMGLLGAIANPNPAGGAGGGGAGNPANPTQTATTTTASPKPTQTTSQTPPS